MRDLPQYCWGKKVKDQSLPLISGRKDFGIKKEMGYQFCLGGFLDLSCRRGDKAKFFATL
jgi:hypothetical protein